MPPKQNSDKKAGFVLWVSTIRSVKQPLLYLTLAKRLPEYKFVMIGGEGEDPDLFRKIRSEATKIPNLDFKGFVSHDKIFTYYQQAALLVNTSKTEGFPMIFLEAWSYFNPIVSLHVDPDELISKHKLGYCSKHFDQMVTDIRTLLTNNELRQTMGKNARKYVEEQNDVKRIAEQYETVMQNLLNNGVNT
jgi:glycosyltransferase involved in cell wall biosynthesis